MFVEVSLNLISRRKKYESSGCCWQEIKNMDIWKWMNADHLLMCLDKSINILFLWSTFNFFSDLLSSNGSKALELTHPDYADVSADNLAATISDSPISYEVLYAALVRLEITKDKDLVEHFKTTPFSGDLKVTQSALFS